MCGSRILVEHSLLPRFREAFVQRVKALRVGDPSDPASDLGAVVSKDHMEKVLAYIRRQRPKAVWYFAAVNVCN